MDSMKLKNQIISLLLVTLIFSGCINDNGNNHKEKQIESFYYYLHIINNGNNQSEIFFPIPIVPANELLQNNKISELVNELAIISGNGTFEIIQTEKGEALKIMTNNEIIIEAKKEFTNLDISEYTDYLFYDLSMKNDSVRNEYFIYSNSTDNVPIIIKQFNCYWKSTPPIDETYKWKLENTNFDNGWKSISLRI